MASLPWLKEYEQRIRAKLDSQSKRRLADEICNPAVVKLDWNRETLRDGLYEKRLNGARAWCEANCSGTFSCQASRGGGQPGEVRFLFSEDRDAVHFRLSVS